MQRWIKACVVDSAQWLLPRHLCQRVPLSQFVSIERELHKIRFICTPMQHSSNKVPLDKHHLVENNDNLNNLNNLNNNSFNNNNLFNNNIRHQKMQKMKNELACSWLWLVVVNRCLLLRKSISLCGRLVAIQKLPPTLLCVCVVASTKTAVNMRSCSNNFDRALRWALHRRAPPTSEERRRAKSARLVSVRSQQLRRSSKNKASFTARHVVPTLESAQPLRARNRAVETLRLAKTTLSPRRLCRKRHRRRQRAQSTPS